MLLDIETSKIFYTALPVLHGVGSILALVLSFACDTGKGVQTAVVPRIVPGYSDATFLAAYPWDEDNDFVTHTWNPFALIFLFECLTAGFALRPLAYYHDPMLILRVWLLWLAVGLVFFILWCATNSGGVCVAMLLVGIFSFIISAMIAVAYFDWPETLGYSSMDRRVSDDAKEQYRDHCGRVWAVPKTSKCSKASLRGETADEPAVSSEAFEADLGVAVRYAEYCVTAPLLFLAVVCLLTVEGPAWLYLTGYWLLVVCNALGIVLHMDFMYDDPTEHENKAGVLPWLLTVFFSGPWSSAHSNQTCLLQTAWICLLLPLSGLVFVIRGYIFSSQLPVLAQFMIWNLLITYSLFGVVPSVVYLSRIGRGTLPALLDILNIAAKFPLPIIILTGFISRPATTKFCYN